MEYIIKVLKNENSSYDELINCFNIIKEHGDVIVIKFDGERLENQYTIFISFPLTKKDLIRVDGNDLKIVMKQVLLSYTN